ncbi:MAG: hypothetical protein V1709_05190 [Planctomycetota bacterium]
MTEKQYESTTDDIMQKYESALDKVGGRLKLTSILIQRLKELRHGGLKQKGSFNTIMEILLNEILDGDLTWEEPKKQKK